MIRSSYILAENCVSNHESANCGTVPRISCKLDLPVHHPPFGRVRHEARVSGEGALPYVSPLESFRLRSLPGFADPPFEGRVISAVLKVATHNFTTINRPDRPPNAESYRIGNRTR